jgi:F-type H+-transporting ATPase subunit delta
MATSVYANRYAQAVFRMALESNELNIWQADLRKMASMARDEALFATLGNEDIPFEDRAKTLSGRIGEINPNALKLVSMLAAKGRLGLIEDISDQYQDILDSHRGVEGAEIAEVTTAVPLDDEYRLKLAQRITDLVGRPVVLRANVDTGVVGGIIIRVGDKLIDGSIRSRLVALRRELGGSGR